MPGKITAYIDSVSPYAYFALVHLERNRQLLKSHNVDLDVIPVFLGGINVGSGNKPPGTLPAKGNYNKFDNARAGRYFNLPALIVPSFFPILSLLPQRALVYVKAAHPELFTQTFINMCTEMWHHEVDSSKPEELAKILKKTFNESDVRDIIEKANSPPIKEKLNANTKEALDRGAFGCPWFWVKNSKGEEEPFFGSDRFHFMWQYLGLPWNDIKLLEPTEKAKI